jgi:aminoglycoside phosphotransferase family enzyme
MANDNITIINVATGEEITREMTDAEQAARNAEIAAWTIEQASIEAAAQAKAEAQASAVSKLAALGLTEDEIAALRG